MNKKQVILAAIAIFGGKAYGNGEKAPSALMRARRANSHQAATATQPTVKLNSLKVPTYTSTDPFMSAVARADVSNVSMQVSSVKDQKQLISAIQMSMRLISEKQTERRQISSIIKNRLNELNELENLDQKATKILSCKIA